MSKYLFVLARGPQDRTPVGQCLRLAKLAVHKGHEVCLYLTGEAVDLVSRSQPKCAFGTPSRPADDPCRLFASLRGSRARIMLDKRSARERLAHMPALPGDLSVLSDAAMLDMAETSKVFSF
ncbi:DsrE family protein [Solidesulfovibrio sp.]|uniref:DsrE family protein n=1 Tax=Solidesulfovibrio sp. TaxID=2910990 RepID=UPI00261A297F|nr:DsrE family protein [Solidesulfovibrio sp.]